jgi:hypothetical protein
VIKYKNQPAFANRTLFSTKRKNSIREKLSDSGEKILADLLRRINDFLCKN